MPRAVPAVSASSVPQALDQIAGSLPLAATAAASASARPSEAALASADCPPVCPPERAPVIRAIAMPADTNPTGDIFGGWLMAQMDLAASNLASRLSRGRAATIAVDGMTFLKPVKVGDEVSFYAELERLGRSSMRIHVEAWRRDPFVTESIKVTDASFTFVAIDMQGRPRPVPRD